MSAPQQYYFFVFSLISSLFRFDFPRNNSFGFAIIQLKNVCLWFFFLVPLHCGGCCCRCFLKLIFGEQNKSVSQSAENQNRNDEINSSMAWLADFSIRPSDATEVNKKMPEKLLRRLNLEWATWKSILFYFLFGHSWFVQYLHCVIKEFSGLHFIFISVLLLSVLRAFS